MLIIWVLGVVLLQVSQLGVGPYCQYASIMPLQGVRKSKPYILNPKLYLQLSWRGDACKSRPQPLRLVPKYLNNAPQTYWCFQRNSGFRVYGLGFRVSGLHLEPTFAFKA